MREVQQIVRDKTPVRNEVFFTGDSGISGNYDYIFKPVLDANGEVEMIVGTTRDVTVASRARAQAVFLAQLGQKLSVVSDEAEINRLATAELGRFLGAQRAFCLQLLPGGQRIRVLPDWRSADQRPLAGDYPLSALGSADLITALSSGTVAIGDVNSHPWTAPRRQELPPASDRLPRLRPLRPRGPLDRLHRRRLRPPPPLARRPESPPRKRRRPRLPLIERARIEAALRNSVAELRTAQDALHEANNQLGDRAAHLEAIVQQRTHKLSETIGELEAFSYSISHDLRSPLRSMIGFSDILLEEYTPKFDATGIDYLKRIGRAGRRMDRLIQDVLNFSRISSAEIILQPVRTDLLLRDVIRSYPNLQAEHVTITLSPGLPLVRAHEGPCSPSASPTSSRTPSSSSPADQPVLIDVWAQSENGRTRLYFKDNGIGIPEHSLKRIFDIFQRVGRDAEGTGIGLAIVRRATEKMGGTVGVQSAPGEGSLFWLDLESAAPEEFPAP